MPDEAQLYGGAELLVNTTTHNPQDSAVVAALPNGFIVAWRDQSRGPSDPSGTSVRAQRFDLSGAKAGAEFQVNVATANTQSPNSIVALADGNFVISWFDDSHTDGEIDGAIKAAIYNSATGAIVRSEFRVNTLTNGNQFESVLASLSSGGFVAVWSESTSGGHDGNNHGVVAQIFAANGDKIGGEFLVNTTIPAAQNSPAVAALGTGFVVAWTDYSAAPGDVKMQLFDAAGAKIGVETLVNTRTANRQSEPHVAALPNGGFVITWQDEPGEVVNALIYDIKAQVFDAAGNKVGGEFLVSTETANGQWRPQVAALADGGFIIVWTDDSLTGGDSSESAIKAQRFDSQGNRVGETFLVNVVTGGDQQGGHVAVLADGAVVVTWDDDSHIGGDASWTAIKARIFHDEIVGTEGPDNLTGGAAADRLRGLAGDDLLDGGGGADRMIGGLGNDVYVVDMAGDVVDENPGEGSDEIRTGLAAYSLAGLAAVEELTGTSNAGQALTGNALVNLIGGGSGNDVIDGGAGADTMAGGLGHDIYVADHSGDTVIEAANAGADTVRSSVSFILGANVENLTLTGVGVINATGNTLANSLAGNGNSNLLNGGGAADSMAGGLGHDTYVVDHAGDTVTEAANAGADTVQSSVSFILGANVENLTLTGVGVINATGNALANSLAGNGNSNRLDGGAGADSMVGGPGHDTYVVDNAGDTVTEAANAGTDTVLSSVSFTLGSNIENLTLTGVGVINGTGNALANSLTGNGNSNRLDGAAGADTMTGGLGHDVYVVDNAGDKAVEAANAGSDRVESSVTFTLGANVENLVLTGAAAVNGTGNGLANALTGNDAANLLRGGAGHDLLRGGAGADSFQFDTAPGTANIDHIADLAPGSDRILLENAVFAGLAAGALPASAFATGTSATNASHRILYDAATGALRFDADGSGGGAAILFAILDTRPATLTASDFLVI
jgi:serralysin